MQYSKEKKLSKSLDFNQKLIDRSLKAAAFILLITAIYTIGFGDNNIFEYFKKVETRNNLQAQIDTIKRENQDLEKKIYYLQNDPFYVEKMARENLGLMKDNEEVYVIVGMKKESKEENQESQERWIDKIKAKYQQFKLQ
ncbi:FtsB family cell division protein [Sulfurihydrogenibium azorense]|jgi:cell division protein FtsB|uniref:FtsB family cell division protein n=1 Tax=Sulfurihydrogenibium azorense TaxID=309806 RepID=UPI002409068E|nr:septum formation initiator family protein [Sulfurihydrogenibium azorense]MDM7273316.1 septum formation initiator family protein [Sulfurihydrogenibium azorense]